MDKVHILENMTAAIVACDSDEAIGAAQAAVDARIDPLEAVEAGISKGMTIVGEKFEAGEFYLPELLLAAEAFKAAMDVLQPEITAQKKTVASAGTVLIGSVKGDVHNIGKNIVAIVLGTKGFTVVDMGVDIASLQFIEEARCIKADIIALSAIMTTTMPAQAEVIETLNQMGRRDQHHVIIGGGSVSPEWSDQIGADGYGTSAIEAVEAAQRLMHP